MGEWQASAQLRKWVAMGMLTERQALEVDETLDMLIDFVKLGAISDELARAIIDAMAEELVSGYAEQHANTG